MERSDHKLEVMGTCTSNFPFDLKPLEAARTKVNVPSLSYTEYQSQKALMVMIYYPACKGGKRVPVETELADFIIVIECQLEESPTMSTFINASHPTTFPLPDHNITEGQIDSRSIQGMERTKDGNKDWKGC